MRDKSIFGDVPIGWSIRKLGDLTTKIGSGATPTGGEKAYLPTRDHFALIRSQCVHDRRFDVSSVSFITDDQAKKLGNAVVHPGDVLLNITGDGVTFSRAAEVPVVVLPAYVNQHVSIIRANPDLLLPGYLLAFLTHPDTKSYIEAFSSGGSRRAITKGHIQAFELPLPPLREQRAIVEVLSSLDDKIELNRRMNETLEAMAQAIFRDWFVDFGPTRRKLEGATDPVTIMGGLVTDQTRAQEMADLFPATLGDDGLPEGWETRVVGDLLEDSIGGDWGSEVPEGQSNHRIAVIRGTDLPAILEGGIGAVPYRYTTLKKAQRRTLRSDDIVIEVSGGSPKQPTGRSMLVTQGVLDRFDSDVVCASFCRRFRPLSPRVSILLSVHLSVLYAEGGTWKYQNQSTGISNFQTTLFLETERVNWGGELIADAFEGLVGPMIERMRTNENMALAATRDLLLPKLMSGEIRLGEAEDIVEAAQ